jgi:hypothetical protein
LARWLGGDIRLKEGTMTTLKWAGKAPEATVGAGSGKRGPNRVSLAKRLAGYAAAAGATAAATLLPAQPAQAGIIYTPEDINFTSGIVFIDFNHVNEFKITNELGRYGVNSLSVIGNGNPAKVVVQGNGAAALAFGAMIGAGDKFTPPPAKMVSAYLTQQSTSLRFGGHWKNVSDEYLGLAFLINGQAHYGWAEFSVTASLSDDVVDATLLGYAYDTVANQSITAGQTTPGTPAGPEPGTLGLLALGSLGIALWPKQRLVAAKSK